jgi:hypothetical protein
MRATNRPKAPPVPGTDDPPTPDPIQILCGHVLCRLRVWSESQWAAVPPSRRPTYAHFAAGLGWIVAVPESVMN